jgi:hypothetical protein
MRIAEKHRPKLKDARAAGNGVFGDCLHFPASAGRVAC